MQQMILLHQLLTQKKSISGLLTLSNCKGNVGSNSQNGKNLKFFLAKNEKLQFRLKYC